MVQTILVGNTHQWLGSQGRICQYQAYPGIEIRSQQHSSHTADQYWKVGREKISFVLTDSEKEWNRERERERVRYIYSHKSTVSLLLEQTL